MAPDSTHLHHGDEATEQTPLLTENSSSSSSTLEASSPRPEDQDVPNYAVSRLRGLAVSASLFILIFIQSAFLIFLPKLLLLLTTQRPTCLA